MAITRDNTSKPAGEKHHTKAFCNWVIRDPEDPKKILLKSSRGFALQDHPNYPNKAEAALLTEMDKRGGQFKVIMEMDIRVNPVEVPPDLSSL